MNSILRICVLSTLCVVAQHTEVLTICLNFTPDIHFMIEFTISSGLRVHVNESREIYYSVDSC